MTIRIGADPNWYSGEQIAQDRAWGEVLQALTERRRREDADAKMAGQLISQFPDPTLIQEMSQKYGDNASFRMAVEAAKRRSGLNEKFFSGVQSGQRDYRDAVHGYGEMSESVPAYNALPMLGPMAGAMAQQAAQGMGRNIMNMDPSGVEQGFQGLSPGEQAQFVPYAHQAYGLNMDRLLPERPGYGDFNKDVAGTLYATRAFGGDPNQFVAATQIGSNLIPSPRHEAEKRLEQVISNENSERDLREQKKLEDYKQPLALERIREQQKGADYIVDSEGNLVPKPPTPVKTPAEKKGESPYVNDLKALTGPSMTPERAKMIESRVEKISQLAASLDDQTKAKILSNISPDKISADLQAEVAKVTPEGGEVTEKEVIQALRATLTKLDAILNGVYGQRRSLTTYHGGPSRLKNQP